MKYRDISWNLMINDEQASFDDETLDFIAEEIQRGNTSGFFTSDCTDYAECEELRDLLEQELGRKANYSVDLDDKGELYDLLEIAKKQKDNYVIDLINKIIKTGFEE